MHAIYMRSVISPGRRTGKFKLKYHHNPNIDVFSQVQDPFEASEYQEDSFCVGDEFEETGKQLHDVYECLSAVM